MSVKPAEKRFRFDSFATEFDCKEEHEDIPDNDSGIDSEETQVSPGSVQQHPLSLVLKKEIVSSKAPAGSPPPSGAMRHWKKFMKDQAIDTDDSGPKEEPNQSTRTTVAHALLSLRQAEPKVSRSEEFSKAFHRMPPFAQNTPFRPIPITLLKPANQKPYSGHPLPWVHHSSSLCHEPENLSIVKLPQHPIKPLICSSSSSSSPQSFLQSPTLSSTTGHHSSSFSTPSPLREIQSNRQQTMPTLPLQPISHANTNANASSSPTPSFCHPSHMARFLHPAFHSENVAVMTPSQKNKAAHKPSAIEGGLAGSGGSGRPGQQPSSAASSRVNNKTSMNGFKGIKADKPFRCLECKKSFSTRSGYAKHEQLHCTNQIQKSFSCKYCNKGYTSLSALKMHIRTHTLPCKCDICGKSFSRPWLLQGHVRTHTGEKPFSCSYCTRSFADKSNLRAHLQTHLQTKKYSCPGCKKTFSRMSLLNKHTDSGCHGLQSRNEECVQTLMGLSAGGLMRA
ncbi:hypothetical protein TCAL_09524 [Tigriopus californicus]|uniref:C2H2-type domain-containing protein n=1 Tax=Tigriopus californicus TaxID=6832 RepID=A0A553N9N2_TIGCA|nr:zinc finger protein SNAI2-like [Tigriopus californicus]TRY62154.1 hypothetical protein TCAL_09524 [Tigriopus californicus]|eukprot:TCALIF_09524-PA protein Name:"Similar to SNAI2 Zinc finger protein SNAI2 (Bos taurus)" AED:0.10 eAED:0.10 QI:151/1/0.5/1/1/1/2/0/506